VKSSVRSSMTPVHEGPNLGVFGWPEPGNGWTKAVALFLIATALLMVFAGVAMAAAPAAPSGVRLRRYALLVGVDDGGPSRARLRYAISDAHAVGRVLETLGGVAAADLVFVADGTRVAIDRAFAEMEGRLRAGAQVGVRRELIVYYSGHSDEDGLLIGQDRLAYDELRARVERAPADLRVVILDSCGSGAFTRRKGGVRRAPFLVDTSIDMRGHAFLTSSAANESAQESDRISASFFTHYLLSGLRGAADSNQDRRVTLQEAFQFASAETLARTERTQGGPQHAAYEFELTGTGDMVVTDVRGTQAGLVLTPELAGRITVREQGGALVAELRKPAGNTVELGLEPGTYMVTMEQEAAHLEAQVALTSGQRADLLKLAFVRGAPREVAMARGDVGGAPVETVVATPAAHTQTAVKLGLIPRDVDATTDVTAFSFGFLADRAARVRGLQLSLGYNQTDEALNGMQLTVGANVARGTWRGLQLSAVVDLATGSGRGAQVSGFANGVRGDLRGLQLSGTVNLIDGEVRGAQIAGGINGARTARGLQLAGAVNLGEHVDGLQVAPVNVAGDVRGFQLGVVNVSGAARGFRLGVVNVARESHGFQLGVVNVAERDDGESFAILNLIGNGIHDVAVYASDAMLSNLAVKLGGRHLFTSFTFAFSPGDELATGPQRFERGSRRLGFGAGLGWRAPIALGRLEAIEIEASSLNVHSDFSDWEDSPTLSSLRATAIVRLAPHLTLLAGAGANVTVSPKGGDLDLGVGLPQYTGHSDETTVRVYPGFLLGLQL
jgi:hypothetical protein